MSWRGHDYYRMNDKDFTEFSIIGPVLCEKGPDTLLNTKLYIAEQKGPSYCSHVMCSSADRVG